MANLPAGRDREGASNSLIRNIGALAGVIAVALLTWPRMPLVPLPGLDQSWVAGLHLAAYHHLHFGSDVDFTFGPLGFLASPTVHSTPTALLAWAYWSATHLALTAVTFAALRRWLRPLAALVVALPIVGLGLLDPAELMVVVAFLVTMMWVQGSIASRPRFVAALLGAGAGVQLLVKFSTGIAILGLAALAALVLPGRIRNLLALGAGVTIATLGAWIATGQVLGQLLQYITHSISLTSGYSAAMALEEPARHREYLWAAIALVVMIGCLVAVGTRVRRTVAFGMVLLVAGFAYVEFRRGFVRHDSHSWCFFLAALVIPAAFDWPQRRALIGVMALITTGAFMVGSVSPHIAREALNPASSVRALRLQVRTLFDPTRRVQARIAGRDAIQRADPLDPAIRAALRGGVHVDPYETAIVWAYGLRWRPLPLFQSYTAFTASLDETNANAIDQGRGPDTILRPVKPAAVDGRHPSFESPASMVALVCHYREVARDATWQVLHRVGSRCGPVTNLGHVVANAGARIQVPPPPAPDTIVVGRIEVQRTALDAVREMVFKPTRPARFVDTTGSFRFILGTAHEPHLLRVPASARFASGESPDALAIDWFELRGVTGPVRVEFEAIPIAP